MVSAVQFDCELKLPKGIAYPLLPILPVIMGFPLIRKVGFYRKKKDTQANYRSERANILVKVATSKFFDGRANGITTP
jgi:hypothetical protein